MRYFRRWFRKTECSVCGSHVGDVVGHARWHIMRGEGHPRHGGTHRAYRDITVDECGHIEDTRWCTTSVGPM